MSTIIRKSVNGNEYLFICRTWETRTAWGHEVELQKNGFTIGENRVRYYNRTWERYEYQTAARGAVRGVIDMVEARIFEEYKKRNGLQRLTAARKGEALKGNTELLELNELVGML